MRRPRAATAEGDAQRRWVLDALLRYEAPLLRFAGSMVGPGLAADVVQDTFMRLCKQERSELAGHEAAWLFKVCRHRAIDVIRARQKQQELADVEHEASPDSGPVRKLERKESLSRVGAAIRALPDRHRQVVLLKLDGGLSYRQIAEVMELSPSNVGFILHQAMTSIRNQLAREEDVSLPALRRAT